jgi:hypothetical protein
MACDQRWTDGRTFDECPRELGQGLATFIEE